MFELHKLIWGTTSMNFLTNPSNNIREREIYRPEIEKTKIN